MADIKFFQIGFANTVVKYFLFYFFCNFSTLQNFAIYLFNFEDKRKQKSIRQCVYDRLIQLINIP